MSRYAYFYKLNSREGKESLYSDLTSKTKFKRSFADYMEYRAADCGSSFDVTCNQVVYSVADDFDAMRPGELWEIVRWYKDEVYDDVIGVGTDWQKREQALNALLKGSGIELLFEFTGSTAGSYAFTNQLNNYCDQYPVEQNYEGDHAGSNMKSDGFLRFLDYMIILICKLNETGCNDTLIYADNYTHKELQELERVWLQYSDDFALHAFIDNEVEWLKECFLKREEEDIGWMEKIAIQGVWDMYGTLSDCLNSKASINEDNTNIVMITG